MALVNDQGALMAFGTAEPTPAPDGFDVKGATPAAETGVLLEHERHAVPVLLGAGRQRRRGRGEAGRHGVLGAPLWGTFASVDALADAVAKRTST